MHHPRNRNTSETLPMRFPALGDRIWKILPHPVVDELVQYLNDCPKGRRL